MSKRAQLPDGTILEFPDDTPDAVMDRAVRRHMGRGTAADVRAEVGEAQARDDADRARSRRRVNSDPLMLAVMSPRNNQLVPAGLARQSPDLPNPGADPAERARRIRAAVNRPLPRPLVTIAPDTFSPANIARAEAWRDRVNQYGAARAIGRMFGGDVVPEDPVMEAAVQAQDPSRDAYNPDESWFTTFRRGLHTIRNQSIGETINNAPRALVRGGGVVGRRLIGDNFGNSLERGLNMPLALVDLGAYKLEQMGRSLVGSDTVDNINEGAAQILGTNPEGAAGSLVTTINDLARIPQDPTLARAGQRYAESDGFISGVGNYLDEIIRNPSSIPNLLAEQAPSLALGYGAGRGATAVAAPLIERLAISYGPRTAAAAQTGIFGAAMNSGATASNIGQNVAGRYFDPELVTLPGETRLDASVREGTLQTAGQLPGAALAGALLPVRTPIRGYAGVVPNTLLQSGIQGLGGMASTMGGNMAIGRETSDAELASALGGSAILAPVDLVARMRAERAARIDAATQEYADFARTEEATRARDGRTADDFPAWSDAPARDPSTGAWRHTEDGIVAGQDGTPTVFRNHRDAATFAVDNELGGSHEREYANGGIILRRRPAAQEAEAPRPAAEEPPVATPPAADRPAGQLDLFHPDWSPPARESGTQRAAPAPAPSAPSEAVPETAAAAPPLAVDPASPAPLTEAVIRAGGINDASDLASSLPQAEGRAALPFGLVSPRGASIDALATQARDAGLIEGEGDALRQAFVDRLASEIGAPDEGGARAARFSSIADDIDAADTARTEAPDIERSFVEAAERGQFENVGLERFTAGEPVAFEGPDGQEYSGRFVAGSGDAGAHLEVTGADGARVASLPMEAADAAGYFAPETSQREPPDSGIPNLTITRSGDGYQIRGDGAAHAAEVLSLPVERQTIDGQEVDVVNLPTDQAAAMIDQLTAAGLSASVDEGGRRRTVPPAEGETFEDRSPAPAAANAGPDPDRTASVRRAAETAVIEDEDAPTPARAAETVEDRPKPALVKDAGPYDPEFLEHSFTNRESIYDSAAIAAGHEPAALRLLPGPEQVQALVKTIRDTFGVEVTVKKGMQDRFAIDQMLDAFQNLRGMAFILGLPNHAISLGGGLKLQLMKSAPFLGAYAPGDHRIMLPGRSNSFAHEWGHALDFHLLNTIGRGRGKGLSGAIRQRQVLVDKDKLPASRDVFEAFIDLINAMFFKDGELAMQVLQIEARIAAARSPTRKAELQQQIERIMVGAGQSRQGRTDFWQRARAMDGPGEEGGSTYWSSPTEMIARSFEAYVSYRAELQGFSTEFIGKGDAAYLSDADQRFAKTFPKEEERAAIFGAYDVLFNQIATAELLGQGPAVRPGAVTTTRADLFRLPKLAKQTWFSRLMANEYNAISDFMIRRAKEAEGRPDDPKGRMQRVADVASFYGYGMTSRWKMLARRYNSPTLNKLHDLLTHRSGSGALTGRGLIHAVRLRENHYVNRLDRAMERNGFRRKGGVRVTLTSEESRILRDLLISEKVEDAPENLVEMAAEMRRIEDEVFYDLQRAGIDVGYTRNGHLQRMLDMPKVMNDETGFKQKAAEVYELVFDKEQGSVDRILEDGKRLTAFINLARALARRGHDLKTRPVASAVTKLKQLIEGGAEQAAIDTATDALRTAMEALHPAVRSAFALQAAEDWMLRVKSAAPDEFDKTGPDNAFTKSRRLPPEADKILEDFYINDPVEVMATYLEKAARRIEYADRFGQDNAKLKAMFDQMAAEGVHPEDIETVRDMFNIVTGRQATRLVPSVNNFVSAVHTIWGTIALLPRAVFSSLSESVTAGIVTENPLIGLQALGTLISGALGSAKGKERAEVARFIGLIESHGGAEVLANRFGGTYGDVTRWDRISAKMFHNSGLVALTRAQHTHLIAPAHAFLDMLAGRIIAGAGAREGARAAKHREDALARYRELGIRDPDGFAKEIRETGRIPTLEELTLGMEGRSGYAFDWITAVDRFRDQVIQNPSAMDRTMAANSAVGRLAYGIMSFNYAFWRNIIKGSFTRAYERAKRNGFAYSAERFALGLMPAVLLLLVAQTLISSLREWLTNRHRWDQWEKEGTLGQNLAWLGVTRTFGTPLDPLVQGFTGLKYQRDITAVPLGPAAGNLLQNIQAMAMPFIQNSPNTNTAEYNAARGFWRGGVGPILGTFISALPGGPLVSTAAGVGTAYVTSPSTADEFATGVVGESDARKRRRRRAGGGD